MGCRSVPSRPPEARLRSEVAGPAFGAPTELLARAITADVLGRREVRGYVGEVDGEAAVTASEVGYGVHERVGFTTPGTPALLGLASLSWPVRRPGTVAVQLERVAVRPMIPPTARRTRIRPDREERVAFRRPAAGRSPASIRSYSWPSITKASALASSYGNAGSSPTVDDANASRRLSTPSNGTYLAGDPDFDVYAAGGVNGLVCNTTLFGFAQFSLRAWAHTPTLSGRPGREARRRPLPAVRPLDDRLRQEPDLQARRAAIPGPGALCFNIDGTPGPAVGSWNARRLPVPPVGGLRVRRAHDHDQRAHATAEHRRQERADAEERGQLRARQHRRRQ